MLERYEPSSPARAARKQQEANALGNGLNINDMEMEAHNLSRLVVGLGRQGRVNESLFWSNVMARLRAAIVDSTMDGDAYTERRLYSAYVRGQAIALRMAVAEDGMLATVGEDTTANKWARKNRLEWV